MRHIFRSLAVAIVCFAASPPLAHAQDGPPAIDASTSSALFDAGTRATSPATAAPTQNVAQPSAPIATIHKAPPAWLVPWLSSIATACGLLAFWLRYRAPKLAWVNAHPASLPVLTVAGALLAPMLLGLSKMLAAPDVDLGGLPIYLTQTLLGAVAVLTGASNPTTLGMQLFLPIAFVLGLGSAVGCHTPGGIAFGDTIKSCLTADLPPDLQPLEAGAEGVFVACTTGPTCTKSIDALLASEGMTLAPQLLRCFGQAVVASIAAAAAASAIDASPPAKAMALKPAIAPALVASQLVIESGIVPPNHAHLVLLKAARVTATKDELAAASMRAKAWLDALPAK